MDDNSKKWYQSKLVWTGVITVVASLLQAKYGYVVLDGTTQGVVLGALVVVLRLLTNKEIS